MFRLPFKAYNKYLIFFSVYFLTACYLIGFEVEGLYRISNKLYVVGWSGV